MEEPTGRDRRMVNFALAAAADFQNLFTEERLEVIEAADGDI